MKSNKGLMIVLLIIVFSLSLEGLRLYDTVKSIKITKEITNIKNYNSKLQKKIAKNKIELTNKTDLDTIKKRAEIELEMEHTDFIKYIKVVESVLK